MAYRALSKHYRGIIKKYHQSIYKSIKGERLNYYNECKKITELNVSRLEHIEKRKFLEYDVGHIVPISFGFTHNIPPALIGSLDNLRIIPSKDNSEKGRKIIPTANELIRKWGY